MKIAFLLYPTKKVKINEDSSFWIMHELQKRGHSVFYFESHELNLFNNTPMAFLRPALLDKKHGYLPSKAAQNPQALSAFDCIVIRKEPPFNSAYLYCLQILDSLRGKVFMMNDPRGIAMANEKIASLLFPGLCPESLVTENVALLKNFINNMNGAVIVKPLDQKGGAGIFSSHAKDRNLPSLLEIATHHGKEKILVQRFISADKYGDKRIVLLNGEVLGAFLRKPSKKDLRANLSAGATMHDAVVTKKDKRIVEAIRPYLVKNGLYFTGIDVIGGYLTEINVTSPAGIPEINYFKKTSCEKKVADFIEKRLGLL